MLECLDLAELLVISLYPNLWTVKIMEDRTQRMQLREVVRISYNSRQVREIAICTIVLPYS